MEHEKYSLMNPETFHIVPQRILPPFLTMENSQHHDIPTEHVYEKLKMTELKYKKTFSYPNTIISSLSTQKYQNIM